MLNRYPIWKYLLIALVVVLGFVYSLPNLYPDDPAIQISGSSSSTLMEPTVLERTRKTLEKAGIAVKSTEGNERTQLVRLEQADQQQLARSLVRDALGDEYVVALNLAPTTPAWLTAVGAHPMKLGLDLSGGVHFLLEVDTHRAVQQRLDIAASEIRAQLRQERLRYRTMPVGADGTRQLAFIEANIRNVARGVIERGNPDLMVNAQDQGELYIVSFGFSEQQVRELEDNAIRQNLTSIRNRVDELGVSEPIVQRQGRNSIVVQLPGVQDTAEAKRILGQTANLEFRFQALQSATRTGSESFPFRNEDRPDVLLERDIIISGDRVSNAQSNFDYESGQPQVNITLDNAGGRRMNEATRRNIGRSMAVIFIEQKPATRVETQVVDGESIRVEVPGFREEKRVISLATIQSTLGNQFRITGLNSAAEASELALLLRAGSLAAPMYFAEERTIGPSLGAENIKMGVSSTLIGLSLVMMFMMGVYRVCGLLANIALTINLTLLLAVMSLFGATLTMPGIAGIVLTLGMAVDANVLIFSRIREEIRQGHQVQRAIHDGFNRAFISIFDGNITTLLVGAILFSVGTGPIKGFAVTLSIGIAMSMFTAITVTRSLVNLVYGGRRDLKTISI